MDPESNRNKRVTAHSQESTNEEQVVDFSCVRTTVWLHHLIFNKMPDEKARCEKRKDVLFWTNSWSSTPRNNSCTATYLPPISQTIQVSWTKRARYDWRSKEKLINDVLSHMDKLVSSDPQKTYIHHLFADSWYHLKDLLIAMTVRKSMLSAYHGDEGE